MDSTTNLSEESKPKCSDEHLICEYHEPTTWYCDIQDSFDKSIEICSNPALTDTGQYTERLCKLSDEPEECISFWRKVMEKNLQGIKVSVLGKGNAKQATVRTDLCKENTDEIVRNAVNAVHAEYKTVLINVLKRLQAEQLEKLKNRVSAQTINESVTDKATLKRDIEDLNNWQSVSTKKKRIEQIKEETFSADDYIGEQEDKHPYLCDEASTEDETLVVEIQHAADHDEISTTISEDDFSLIEFDKPLFPTPRMSENSENLSLDTQFILKPPKINNARNAVSNKGLVKTVSVVLPSGRIATPVKENLDSDWDTHRPKAKGSLLQARSSLEMARDKKKRHSSLKGMCKAVSLVLPTGQIKTPYKANTDSSWSTEHPRISGSLVQARNSIAIAYEQRKRSSSVKVISKGVSLVLPSGYVTTPVKEDIDSDWNMDHPKSSGSLLHARDSFELELEKGKRKSSVKVITKTVSLVLPSGHISTPVKEDIGSDWDVERRRVTGSLLRVRNSIDVERERGKRRSSDKSISKTVSLLSPDGKISKPDKEPIGSARKPDHPKVPDSVLQAPISVENEQDRGTKKSESLRPSKNLAKTVSLVLPSGLISIPVKEHSDTNEIAHRPKVTGSILEARCSIEVTRNKKQNSTTSDQLSKAVSLVLPTGKIGTPGKMSLPLEDGATHDTTQSKTSTEEGNSIDITRKKQPIRSTGRLNKTSHKKKKYISKIADFPIDQSALMRSRCSIMVTRERLQASDHDIRESEDENEIKLDGNLVSETITKPKDSAIMAKIKMRKDTSGTHKPIMKTWKDISKSSSKEKRHSNVCVCSNPSVKISKDIKGDTEKVNAIRGTSTAVESNETSALYSSLSNVEVIPVDNDTKVISKCLKRVKQLSVGTQTDEENCIQYLVGDHSSYCSVDYDY